MPWSKIVKRYQRTTPEVHPYILEEVEAPPETTPETLTHDEGEADADAGIPLPILSPEPERLSPYEEGYATGLREGEAKGFAEGKAQGFVEGEAKGFSEGKAQGVTEGEAKGFSEGEAKGFAKGEALGKTIREEELQEWERTHQMALRLIEDFKYLSETYVADAESDLLQIAIAIARKIIKKELTQDYEGIVEMVQAALKEIPPAQTIVLRVHPQDIEIVTRKKPALLGAIEGIGFLKIESDPQLAPGDSLLETEEHIVDARPLAQLEELEKKLLPPSEA